MVSIYKFYMDLIHNTVNFGFNPEQKMWRVVCINDNLCKIMLNLRNINCI